MYPDARVHLTAAFAPYMENIQQIDEQYVGIHFNHYNLDKRQS